MSGIQKVYSIEESKGRDVESCCSDQNEKTLAFFETKVNYCIFREPGGSIFECEINQNDDFMSDFIEL